MWRYLALAAVLIGTLAVGFSLIDVGGDDISANTIIEVPETSIEGFERAIGPWDWQFPRDHGAHPNFQTEWWYYTGNVQAENGRRFGYQFTIFRRALTPQTVATGSEWRTGQVYMAHFTVTDVEAGQFYHAERYSRGGAGLAGAQPVFSVDDTARYRVWLEDWQVRALDADHDTFQITAQADDFAVDLTLEQAKPIVFHGDAGLSAKSEEAGNASYYYSMTRLRTEGTITVGDATYNVSGNTWMDHEFSTSALGENALGWDWFGLIFDDMRELTLGQIRLVGGGSEPAFGGRLILPDGESVPLTSDDFTLEATGTWESPHSGAVYPAGWVITIDADVLREDEDLRIEVTPLVADQELNSGDITYWEGAVRIEGDASGYGYAELTGYVDALTGRF